MVSPAGPLVLACAGCSINPLQVKSMGVNLVILKPLGMSLDYQVKDTVPRLPVQPGV